MIRSCFIAGVLLLYSESPFKIYKRSGFVAHVTFYRKYKFPLKAMDWHSWQDRNVTHSRVRLREREAQEERVEELFWAGI